MTTDQHNPSNAGGGPCFTDYWLESQHALSSFVYLHVRDGNVADDIIQEVARQATANFDKYDPARPFTAWLIGIARQRIAEMYRIQGRRSIIFSSEMVDGLSQAMVDAQPEINDRLDALRLCMDRLNDRHRRVIELRYARQMSPQEIADQVGGSKTATTTMLHRIRAALKQCIAKQTGGAA